MEEKSTITILNKQTKKLETINIHTGEIVATQGEVTQQFLYTLEMSEAICNAVREGQTLRQISQLDAMPPLFILYNWRNAHPDFKAKLKQARSDRAFYFEDKAIEALEEAEVSSKDDMAGLKLRLDGYTKLAEKANPESFSPKPQLLHGAAAPAMIVINTGINREIIEIEANNEKIRIGGGSEDRPGRVESKVKEGIGAEIGDIDAEYSSGEETSGQEEDIKKEN